MKYYVNKTDNEFELWNTEPPHNYLILNKQQYIDFCRTNIDVEIEERKFVHLNSFSMIYDWLDILKEDIAYIKFGKITEKEMTDYLMNKMIYKDKGDFIWGSKIHRVMDISEQYDTREDYIFAYYDVYDRLLSIKTDKDMIVLNGYRIFSELASLKSIDFEYAISGKEDYSCFFYGCMSLQKLDLTHFDFSSCKSLYKMFYNCENLKEIIFNKDIKYNKVKTISDMLSHCKSLVDVDLTMFNFQGGDRYQSAIECELNYLSYMVQWHKLRRYVSNNLNLVLNDM